MLLMSLRTAIIPAIWRGIFANPVRRNQVSRHPTAGNADRAVLVDSRRLPAVIDTTVTLPFWQVFRAALGVESANLAVLPVILAGGLVADCAYPD